MEWFVASALVVLVPLVWLVVRQNKRRASSGGKAEGTPLLVWLLSFGLIIALVLIVLKSNS